MEEEGTPTPPPIKYNYDCIWGHTEWPDNINRYNIKVALLNGTAVQSCSSSSLVRVTEGWAWLIGMVHISDNRMNAINGDPKRDFTYILCTMGYIINTMRITWHFGVGDCTGK